MGVINIVLTSDPARPRSRKIYFNLSKRMAVFLDLSQCNLSTYYSHITHKNLYFAQLLTYTYFVKDMLKCTKEIFSKIVMLLDWPTLICLRLQIYDLQFIIDLLFVPK